MAPVLSWLNWISQRCDYCLKGGAIITCLVCKRASICTSHDGIPGCLSSPFITTWKCPSCHLADGQIPLVRRRPSRFLGRQRNLSSRSTLYLHEPLPRLVLPALIRNLLCFTAFTTTFKITLNHLLLSWKPWLSRISSEKYTSAFRVLTDTDPCTNRKMTYSYSDSTLWIFRSTRPCQRFARTMAPWQISSRERAWNHSYRNLFHKCFRRQRPTSRLVMIITTHASPINGGLQYRPGTFASSDIVSDIVWVLHKKS
jgi:hypothetical protein